MNLSLPRISLPRLSDHAGELFLLGVIAAGVLGLLLAIVITKTAGWDIAACLLVLQGIIGAIKDRWTARNADAANDRSATLLAAATPPGIAGAAGGADQ